MKRKNILDVSPNLPTHSSTDSAEASYSMQMLSTPYYLPLVTEPHLRLASGRGHHTKKNKSWDFLGSPVAKTLSSQCRGPGFDP